MAINGNLLWFISQVFTPREQSFILFYPDIISFEYKSNEDYIRDLKNLMGKKKGQTKYLYVDHNGIKPVWGIRYAWEHIKGAFGFENHCQQQRVQMAFNKFVYYGYVGNRIAGNLSEAEFDVLASNPYLTNVFKESVKLKKDPLIVTKLQMDLSEFYNHNQLKLRPSLWRRFFSRTKNNPLKLTFPYQFGNAWIALINEAASQIVFGVRDGVPLQEEFARLLVLMEPIDAPVIDALTSKIIENKINLSPGLLAAFRQDPSLASYVATKIIEQARKIWSGDDGSFLDKVSAFFVGVDRREAWTKWQRYAEKAESLDSSIPLKFKWAFIRYYLYSKNYPKALSLIQTIEAVDDQVKWIKLDKDAEANLIGIIPRDSDLAKALAKGYVAAGKVAVAEQLASAQSSPQTFFKQYVKDGKMREAFALIKGQNVEQFDKDSRRKMAEFYVAESNRFYQQASSVKGWTNANKCYLSGLEARKAARDSMPTDSNLVQGVNVFRRLVAQYMLYAPATGSRDQDAALLDKAIKKLERSQKEAVGEPDERLLPALASAYEKRANLAIADCLIDIDTSRGVAANDKHKKICKAHYERAVECLGKLLALTDVAQKPEVAAKFHFMLGDIIRYFSLGDYQSHFALATQYMPSNPFYAFSANQDQIFAETLDSETSAKIERLFRRQNWTHWYFEPGMKSVGKKLTIAALVIFMLMGASLQLLVQSGGSWIYFDAASRPFYARLPGFMLRHCERSEAIQLFKSWIATPFGLAMTRLSKQN